MKFGIIVAAAAALQIGCMASFQAAAGDPESADGGYVVQGSSVSPAQMAATLSANRQGETMAEACAAAVREHGTNPCMPQPLFGGYGYTGGGYYNRRGNVVVVGAAAAGANTPASDPRLERIEAQVAATADGVAALVDVAAAGLEQESAEGGAE
jgi:hypothetical protein